MSQMFQCEVWSPSEPDTLYTVDDFIDGDLFAPRKVNYTRKSYCMCSYFCRVCRWCTVCQLVVTLLHTETFVKMNLTRPLF